MLKTYFFIPANNKRFIEKASLIKADNFIFDLEDSVSKPEIQNAISNLKGIDILKNYYVRFSLFVDNTSKVNTKLFSSLIEIGFRNFVIPKFSNLEQLVQLKKYLLNLKEYSFNSFSFILLIEHPAGLINLDSMLKSKYINIKAVGLGNYDYCNIMGMKHTLENLMFARQTLLTYAKAYNTEAIDIVSLDLNNDEKFCNEVKNGFSLGFNAKFIIHPKQLTLMNKIEYYSKEEVQEAESVYSQIKLIQSNKIAVAKVNGKIYEKPHIDRIINIINWKKDYGSK